MGRVVCLGKTSNVTGRSPELYSRVSYLVIRAGVDTRQNKISALSFPLAKRRKPPFSPLQARVRFAETGVLGQLELTRSLHEHLHITTVL